MPIVVDRTTGTGANPTRAPFSGKKRALVVVAFYDVESEPAPGYMNAAQEQLCGALQTAGLNPSSARFSAELEAEEGVECFVELGVHVAKNVPDETAAE